MLDDISAKRMAANLYGQVIGGWTILDYIDHGKSAVILKAEKGSLSGALKVFDKDILVQYGKENQLTRVEREKILIGKKHPHLIEIIDGGLCKDTDYVYVAMKYLPHNNLAQKIKTVPRDKIFSIISQIASAAKYLEELDLAHRDIKPANIAISDDFTHATLLDMSVLRPVGLSEITDENEQKVFIGTLRYSPPELLYRREKDSRDGWKAINFYQLGAVLYDLIMRKPIFYDHSEPYAILVDAVRDAKPKIKANDVDNNLIFLAKCCLVKDPEKRLSLVSWDDFTNLPENNLKSIVDRINKRKRIVVDREKGAKASGAAYKKLREFDIMTNEIKESIRLICIKNKNNLPPPDTIKIINIEGFNSEICLCFEPSKQHALNIALTVIFKMDYKNNGDEILYINYASFASTACPANVDNNSSNFKAIFKGPYEIKVIEENIYQLLLKLMDKAQEITGEDVKGSYIEVNIS